MRPGRVAWIGLRPARRATMVPVDAAMVDPASGLAGDHYSNSGSRRRQVTLIQEEHLAAVAACLGLPGVAPALLRRNIVVAEVNLHALQNRRIRIGAAVLEITGACHPCSRMEEAFGPGGYNAVRGHGGVTARVIAPGAIRIGDAVTRDAG